MYTSIVLKILTGISYFCNIITALLVIYCLMTWFVRPDSPIYTFIHRLVEPFVAPFRPLALRLMEKGFMIDISVFLAIIAIRVVQSLLWNIAYRFLL